MAGRVYSAAFSLTAIVDGNDALVLVCDPDSIVWNQSDDGSWEAKVITASVLNNATAESGWSFAFSWTNVQASSSGNTCKLISPTTIRTTIDGKTSTSYPIEATVKVTAKKDTRTLTKTVQILINALATWKQTIENGTMTAVSSGVTSEFNKKGLTGDNYEKRITENESKIRQNEKSITSTVTQITHVAMGEGSSADIDLSASTYDVNTFYLVIIFNKLNTDSNGTYSHNDKYNTSDLYYFGVKKDLRKDGADEPKTIYGTWQPENGKGGFETYLDWHEHFSDWGSRQEDRVIDNYTKPWVKDGTLAVGSVGQYTANGPVHVYLRGGTRYHVYCDHTDITIRLAKQADIDSLPASDKAKPTLTLPLASVVEPVPERQEISTEIKQTADDITAKITEQGEILTEVGITKDGINVKGNKFSWKSSSNEQLLYMDGSGNLNITGNVVAKTLSTASGKSKIDENGVLTATDANITGTINAVKGKLGTWELGSYYMCTAGAGKDNSNSGFFLYDYTNTSGSNLDEAFLGFNQTGKQVLLGVIRDGAITSLERLVNTAADEFPKYGIRFDIENSKQQNFAFDGKGVGLLNDMIQSKGFAKLTASDSANFTAIATKSYAGIGFLEKDTFLVYGTTTDAMLSLPTLSSMRNSLMVGNNDSFKFHLRLIGDKGSTRVRVWGRTANFSKTNVDENPIILDEAGNIKNGSGYVNLSAGNVLDLLLVYDPNTRGTVIINNATVKTIYTARIINQFG